MESLIIDKIESERLILRQVKKSDLQDLFEIMSDTRVTQFEKRKPIKNMNEAKKILNNFIKTSKKKYFSYIVLAIVEKNTSKMIGFIQIYSYDKTICKISIGYNVRYEYWGKGYATESIKALIKYLFTCSPIKINRIEGACIPENIASCRVMEKCEMTKEGVARQTILIKNQLKNLVLYAILREDFAR